MIFLLSLFTFLFETYSVEFSYAKPIQDFVSELIFKLNHCPKDDYQWDYIMLNMYTTESGDSLVCTEYFKACDLYVPKQSKACTLFYTVVEKDTILIQGNLSHLFFEPISSQKKVNIKIDSSNMAVEELPIKRFQYKGGKFEQITDCFERTLH